MSKIKFIKCKDMKYLQNGTIDPNYGYAVCECHSMIEVIQVPRPKHTCTVSFKCPKCGKKIDLFMTGKKDLQREVSNMKDIILEVCDDHGATVRVSLSEQEFVAVKRFLEATVDSAVIENIQFVKVVEDE